MSTSATCNFYNTPTGCIAGDACDFVHLTGDAEHSVSRLCKENPYSYRYVCVPSVFGHCSKESCVRIHPRDDVRYAKYHADIMEFHWKKMDEIFMRVKRRERYILSIETELNSKKMRTHLITRRLKKSSTCNSKLINKNIKIQNENKFLQQNNLDLLLENKNLQQHNSDLLLENKNLRSRRKKIIIRKVYSTHPNTSWESPPFHLSRVGVKRSNHVREDHAVAPRAPPRVPTVPKRTRSGTAYGI